MKLRRQPSLLVRLLILVALLPAVILTTAGDWPTYLHDPQRQAASPDEIVLSPATAGQLTKLWSYTTGGTVASSATVVGGVVYVGSWDGYEYALDAATGTLKWRTFLGTTTHDCDSKTYGVSSAAAVQNGVLYVGGGDDYWYALDAATGAIQWRLLIGDTNNGYYNWASPLIYNGFAYIGIASLEDCPLVQGQLLQVNLSTHQIVNTFSVVATGDIGGGIWTSPSIDPSTNTVFVTTGTKNSTSQLYSQAVLALDASTLALKSAWQLPDAQAVGDSDWGTTPIVFTDGSGHTRVAGINKNGIAYAFDATNLAAGPVWQQQIADGGACPTCGDGSVSSGAFGQGQIYLAGGRTKFPDNTWYSGSVRALDPTTGNIIWQHGEPGIVIAALAYANGLVVDGAGSTVEVLNASNGLPLYSYTTGGAIYGAPSIADGRIFSGSVDGNIYAFGLSGTPTATFTPTPASTSPVSTSPTATGTPSSPTNTPTPTVTAAATSTPGTTPGFVQVTSAVPQTSQATVTVTYPGAQNAGDTNILAIGWNDTTATISTVKDSAGNTYQVAAPLTRGSGLSQAIYYAKNIAAAPVNGNTVTVSFNQPATFVDIRALEYSGLDPNAPFDAAGTGAGSASTADSGAVTTQAANEVLVGAGMTTGAFSAAGSGYKSRVITSPDADIAEDDVVSATGSYNATAAVGGAWLMQLATFRAAGSGGPTAMPTNTPTATGTATRTPTRTATNTATWTGTPTAAGTSTETATATAAQTATNTATNTATHTNTPTRTPVPATNTPTTTPVPPTSTATNTPLAHTNTPTRTPVPVTNTPTNTPVSATNTPAPTATRGTPAYVQGTSAVPQSPQSTVTVSYTHAQAAGDLNVVVVGWNDTTASITSVLDSAGNTYQVAVPMGQTTGLRQAIYYAKNIVASATNTVTVSFSQAAVYPDVRILEYANLNQTNPFDVGATGSGTAALANSGSATTAAAAELLVGAGTTSGAFTGAGSSYATRMITSPDADIAEDRVATTSGSYNATAPVAGAWLMQMAAFRT